MMRFVRTSSIVNYVLKAKGLLLSKMLEIMEKFYRPTSKTFLKMAVGRMHTSHPSPLAISYRNNQKILHISVTWHH